MGLGSPEFKSIRSALAVAITFLADLSPRSATFTREKYILYEAS